MDIDNDKRLRAFVRRLIESYRLPPGTAQELLERIISALGCHKKPTNDAGRTQK